MPIIKTPDQKVRVFISSTINELADERKAAREAISNLRLTPVFFEAGARPHPPRDLYSAYLDQSHIFVGIYWNSYGWIAPGATISGLEDEYRLCGNKKPKLIYLRESENRQEKLKALIDDIQNSDTSCYQKFNDSDQLRKLLENDLSLLMSELFEKALLDSQIESTEHILEKIQLTPEKKIELPLIKSEILGRDKDIQSIKDLLLKPTVSLVNILGAGGTGKTTVSIHIAHQLKDQFRDGIVFISLAPITDSTLVAATIAQVLDLTDSGKQPVQQTLRDYLIDKNYLLVLDNFEQITDAAVLVSEIINSCPEVKIMVTSRATLQINGEHIYYLSPLELPAELIHLNKDQLKNYPAVDLFITKAKEINQNLVLNDENIKAIIEICQRLDGLPLAIELAAARTKLFQPVALLNRMDKTLDVLNKGHRDLPQRQQTLRNAIAWSYNLLEEDYKRVFRILGVIKRSWTLEAADAIVNAFVDFIDIEVAMEKLLDVSLIKPVLVSHSSDPRFNMLQTVHEYAYELLCTSSESIDIQLEYAHYFLKLFEPSEEQLHGILSEPWFDKIEYEFQNIRAAFYIFLGNNKLTESWKLFSLMVPYWYVRGGLSEAEQWLTAAHIDTFEENQPDATYPDPLTRGKTYLQASWVKIGAIQFEEILKFTHWSEKYAAIANDPYTLASAFTIDGTSGLYMNQADAFDKMAKAELLIEKTNNHWAKSILLIWPTEYYYSKGAALKARELLKKAIEHCNEYQLSTQTPFLVIGQSNSLVYEKEYQAAIDLYAETLQHFPVKGYKGFKAGFYGGLCYCLMKLNKPEEARPMAYKAMEYARESGDKESIVHTLIGAIIFFGLTNNMEIACKAFGSLDQFFINTNYPVMGNIEFYIAEAKSNLFLNPPNHQYETWIASGRKMSLEEGLVFAMKQ